MHTRTLLNGASRGFSATADIASRSVSISE